MYILIIVPLIIYIWVLQTHVKNLESEIEDNKTKTEHLASLKTKNEQTLTTLKKNIVSLENLVKEKDGEISILESQIHEQSPSSDNARPMTYKEMLSIAQAPDHVSFDKELFPHYYIDPIVNSRMTVYISNTGKCYHRIRGCSGATIPTNLYIAAESFCPCQRCVPYSAHNFQIPLWYYRFFNLAVHHGIMPSSLDSNFLDSNINKRDFQSLCVLKDTFQTTEEFNLPENVGTKLSNLKVTDFKENGYILKESTPQDSKPILPKASACAEKIALLITFVSIILTIILTYFLIN